MSNGNHPRGAGKGQGHQSPTPGSRALRDTKEGFGLTEHLDPEALDALSSLRAGLESNALAASKEPAAGQGQCAHGVNTEGLNMPLTGDAFLAPVVPTGASSASADERQRAHTLDAVPYRTDPDQPRSDLLKRTRSSLATEVRRMRRECARTRIKLREAQARIDELEGGHDA